MKLQREMSADEEDVQDYARIVSDHNPLHVNENYVEADRTFADENIVHGTMIMGWFSGMLENIGDSGPIYGEVVLINMDVDFENPLPVGTDAVVEAKVPPEKMPESPNDISILDVDLEARSRDGQMYASGSATIMVDQTIDTYDHT